MRTAKQLDDQLLNLGDALHDKDPKTSTDAAKKVAQLVDHLKHNAPKLDDPMKRKKVSNIANDLDNIDSNKLAPGVKVSDVLL